MHGIHCIPPADAKTWHTLVYSPQQPPNHPIMYITATVKQTPIIPRRCDSNPPVSPFKALEVLVLQWHVSACLTQSWQRQQRSLHVVAPNRLTWWQWIQGNVNRGLLFTDTSALIISLSLNLVSGKFCKNSTAVSVLEIEDWQIWINFFAHVLFQSSINFILKQKVKAKDVPYAGSGTWFLKLFWWETGINFLTATF